MRWRHEVATLALLLSLSTGALSHRKPTGGRDSRQFGNYDKPNCEVTRIVKCCLCDTAPWQLSLVLEGFVPRIKTAKLPCKF